MALKFSKPVSPWDFIDQNTILYVLINNSRSAWPNEILMPFLSFSRQFAPEYLHYFSKQGWSFWGSNSTQNTLNFGLGCSSPFKVPTDILIIFFFFCFISYLTWVFKVSSPVLPWSPGLQCTTQFDCRDGFSLLISHTFQASHKQWEVAILVKSVPPHQLHSECGNG